MIKTNPILLEVFKNRFESISEEMGVTLTRTGFSPNIKERRDLSCGIFDSNGHMISQATHIPVHLGSMPMSVKSAIESGPWEEGDMVMLNDPFKGGTHLPDITLVAPVFTGNKNPSFFVANRAHHADVGGMTSGSMPLSTSIFQEGIIIPPLKIVEKGVIDRKIMAFFMNNVRTPVEREGDFTAQMMANITGVRRMQDLVDRNGFDNVALYAEALMAYSEKATRAAIKKIPDGEYSFEDFMDDDGFERKNVRIHVTTTIKGDETILDFTKSDTQTPGGINAVKSITLSVVLYVFRSLLEKDIPTNAGCIKPIKILTRKGSVVDAEFPAAVAGGNVEMSQRIADVVLGSLSKAKLDIIPAASQGTMNNVTIGGIDHRYNKPFAYYETIGGGMGATGNSDGESAVHSHMTNTLNTPIEALEYEYPFMVKEYSIRKNTGGKGVQKGGDGIVREIQLLSDAEVTVLSERRITAPYGLSGGEPGIKGKNIIYRNGIKEEKPGKFTVSLRKGDALRIETPGGGGYGK